MFSPSLRSGLRSFLAVAVLVGVGLSAAAQAAVIEGDQAVFRWQPASGPVAGYNVFVIRNDVPSSSPEQIVTGAEATVSGTINDMITVQVAAFDASGNQGPLSPLSEPVLLSAPAPPPPPAEVVVEADGDFSLQDALAAGSSGELVIAHLRGSGKQLLDASPPPSDGSDSGDVWGIDQLIVGLPNQPTTVRLIDAIGLEQQSPLADLPSVTLFGLGNGPACERDGESGLIVHPGSRLVLGGVDLYVFDGESCIHINDAFETSEDPNVIDYFGGQIVLHGDLEEDGVLDPEDNCLLVANVDQCDGDEDGFGNLCDFDIDGDGTTGFDDLTTAMNAARVISLDAVYDFNCDGATGPDDVSMLISHLGQMVGPSGLACSVDASCTAP